MNTKAFEIRDIGTFIPVVGVLMVPSFETDAYIPEKYLLRRAGYGFDSPLVLLCRMEASGTDRNATYDPYAWGDGARTMIVAHDYIQKNWEDLTSGDVIDVQFILKETEQPKPSERLDDLLQAQNALTEKIRTALADSDK